MPLKKVRPGDRLVIPADTFNAFIDAAQAARDGYLSQAAQGGQSIRSGTVRIRNNSGADRSRFDVLGISGIVFTPTDNLQEFQNRVTLTGVTPIASHAGKYVILMEPIKAGSIGLACATGVCPVQINFAAGAAAYKYADVSASQAGYLKAVPFGAAKILWSAGTSGTVWALVLMQGPLGTKGTLKVLDSAAWDRDNPPANTEGLTFSFVTAVTWDGTSLKYSYRTATFDSMGLLRNVAAAPIDVTVNTSEDCTT